MNCNHRNKQSTQSKPLEKRKVLFGKGNEYSEIAREMENVFYEWIAFCGLTVEAFDKQMEKRPCNILERINTDGDVEICIIAGGEQVALPLVFKVGVGGDFNEFLVNVLLVLHYVAARYVDKSFEVAVNTFADKMIKEDKAINRG